MDAQNGGTGIEPGVSGLGRWGYRGEALLEIGPDQDMAFQGQPGRQAEAKVIAFNIVIGVIAY